MQDFVEEEEEDEEDKKRRGYAPKIAATTRPTT